MLRLPTFPGHEQLDCTRSSSAWTTEKPERSKSKSADSEHRKSHSPLSKFPLHPQIPRRASKSPIASASLPCRRLRYVKKSPTDRRPPQKPLPHQQSLP